MADKLRIINRALQRLGAVMRGHHAFDLHQLLGLQRFNLVARLNRLQITDGRLAGPDQAVEGFAIGAGRRDDRCRDLKTFAIGGAGLFPARAGLFDQNLVFGRGFAIGFWIDLSCT